MRLRNCLLYVAAYLVITGLAFLIAPQMTLSAMHSNADYGDIMPRWVGMFSVALGSLVAQVVRHQIVVLYPLGLFMPAAMLFGFAGLYLKSSNPLFLAVFAVVAVGVLATGISLYRERSGAS